MAYLGLCLRGGKTRILVKKRGRKRTKRTNSYVSYQSQGGGKVGVRGGGASAPLRNHMGITWGSREIPWGSHEGIT